MDELFLVVGLQKKDGDTAAGHFICAIAELIFKISGWPQCT